MGTLSSNSSNVINLIIDAYNVSLTGGGEASSATLTLCLLSSLSLDSLCPPR